MNIKSFLLQGYISQILNMLILLIYNLVLPLYLGFDDYGKMIYIFGATYLIISFFDQGYNLLVVKKPFHSYYLYYKLIITTTVLILFSIYYFLYSKLDYIFLIVIIFQTYIYIFYTYFIHLQIACHRNDLFITSSLLNGIALLGIPYLMYINDFNVQYSPLISIVFSFVFVFYINIKKNIFAVVRVNKFLIGISWDLFYKTFVLQITLSFSVMLNAIIIWFGVLYLSDNIGYQDATAYKISLSIVSLLILLIPMHRQSLYKLINSGNFILWLVKYTFLLIIFSLVLISIVSYMVKDILILIYPSNYLQISEVLKILVWLIPFKVILDLQIFILAKFNMTKLLLLSIFASLIISLMFYMLYSIYMSIVILYISLVLANSLLYYIKIKRKKNE